MFTVKKTAAHDASRSSPQSSPLAFKGRLKAKHRHKKAEEQQALQQVEAIEKRDSLKSGDDVTDSHNIKGKKLDDEVEATTFIADDNNSSLTLRILSSQEPAFEDQRHQKVNRNLWSPPSRSHRRQQSQQCDQDSSNNQNDRLSRTYSATGFIQTNEYHRNRRGRGGRHRLGWNRFNWQNLEGNQQTPYRHRNFSYYNNSTNTPTFNSINGINTDQYPYQFPADIISYQSPAALIFPNIMLPQRSTIDTPLHENTREAIDIPVEGSPGIFNNQSVFNSQCVSDTEMVLRRTSRTMRHNRKATKLRINARTAEETNLQNKLTLPIASRNIREPAAQQRIGIGTIVDQQRRGIGTTSNSITMPPAMNGILKSAEQTKEEEKPKNMIPEYLANLFSTIGIDELTNSIYQKYSD